MVKKESKNSDGLKTYIFKADPHSMEGKWLSTQTNRTLSLKILIKKAVRQYGMVDVNSLAIDDFVTNPDTDLASGKDSKIKSDNEKESQNYVDKLKKMLPPDMTEGIN